MAKNNMIKNDYSMSKTYLKAAIFLNAISYASIDILSAESNFLGQQKFVFELENNIYKNNLLEKSYFDLSEYLNKL